MTIEDFSFQPASVTVNVGDSVTWTNADEAAHSATADDGSFDTGTFGKGESRSHEFTEAGTYSYICTPHPSMKGTVRVVAAGSDSPSSGAEGGSDGGRGNDRSSGAGSTDSGPPGSSGSAGADGRSDRGGSLPLTGSELGRLALFGLALTAIGYAVRRRHAGLSA